MHEPVEQLKKLVEPWLPGYNGISVSAVGVRKDDKQFLLSARIRLLSPLQERFERPPLRDSVFWGLTEEVRFIPTDFPDLLQRIVAGTITLGTVVGDLPRDTQSNLSQWFDVERTPKNLWDIEEHRVSLFRITGGSRGILIYGVISPQDVNWHLRSHKPPFRNLSDVLRHYDLAESDSGDASMIELIAAPPMALARHSTFENGRVVLTIRAAKGLVPENISIGYVAESPTETRRGNVDNIRWVEIGELIEGTVELQLGGSHEVDCLLTYAGAGVQHLRLVEARRRLNMRRAIQEAFDPELSKLRQLLLETKRDDSKRFEDGVAMLFGMLGFSVAQHGRASKLADAPDVVATTQVGHIAIVECTTDLPDKGDQVATAAKRAEQVRRGLADSGWPRIEVLPIVITILGEREIIGQKDDAETKGVLVLCAEDLQSALTQTKYPVDPDSLFRRWVARLTQPKFRRNDLF